MSARDEAHGEGPPGWRARLDALPPLAADALLATILLVAFEVEGLTHPDLDGSSVLAALLLAGMSIPWAWRRRAPLVVISIVMACAVALTATVLPAGEMITTVTILAAGPYTAGANCDTGRALAALGVVVGAAFAVNLEMGTPEDSVFTTLFPLVCWLGGRAVRSRGRLAAELREKAERLEDERAERARLAVADERHRIARELHDVVAHGVSGMVIQAQAAQRIVDADPDRAEAAILAVERTGREALDELRRLLGVLRQDEAAAELAPQPTLTRVADLVESVRDTGLPVHLALEGTPYPLPPGIDLAAYRVIQEGLANVAAQPGAAHAGVLVRYHPDVLEIVLSDDNRDWRPDRGARELLGVRERVGLYGGELHARPRPDGGHVLRARFPVARAAA